MQKKLGSRPLKGAGELRRTLAYAVVLDGR